MAVAIISDVVDDTAALYCTTTMVAFGPVFTGPDAEGRAHVFLKWLREEGWDPSLSLMGSGRDPREYSPTHLSLIVDRWVRSTEEVAA